MINPSYRWIIPATMILLAALACNFLGDASTETTKDPTQAPIVEPTQPEPTEASSPADLPDQPATATSPEEPTQYDTEFPLPNDVQNFQNIQEGQINFQTSMTLEEAADFYRNAFTAQGFSELTAATVINEDVISIVFTGAPNGQAIVVQGVVLDANTTNINVRYEDI